MRRTCMKILACALAAALLAGCENIVSRTPRKPAENGQGEGKGGMITVTARVSSGSARSAIPSPSVSDFAYAALFYKDVTPPETPPQEGFAEGTAEGDKIQFSFQRPDETSGFTLEIFAFKAGTTAFSRGSALLSGSKSGLKVVGDAIEVDSIALVMNESSAEQQGTVSLKVKVPDGCTLEISDTRFTVTGTSPDFTVTQVGGGIDKGSYPLTFTVKKSTGETASQSLEYINVSPGLCTNTWDGMAAGEAKEITQASLSKTIYVRGAGGWYDSNNFGAAASDDNEGSLSKPFATIQKAVDTIIERRRGEPAEPNDGTSAYTIYVDGELKGTTDTSGAKGMADFSDLDKDLTLTIKGISSNAALDAGARFDSDGNATAEGIGKRVILAEPTSGKLNLTLENLAVMGGNVSGKGGGIWFYSSGGTLTISDGTKINGNKSSSRGGGVYVAAGGTFTMHGGVISDNTATGDDGGGVYNNSTFTMTGGTISGNKVTTGSGGGVYNDNKFTMTGGTIGENTASRNGGGVYNNSSDGFTMEGGTISGNTAQNGGGVYNYSMTTRKVAMKGGVISDNTASNNGGGVCNHGQFTMSDGTISGNEASNFGGGVYNDSYFTMSDGTIGGNKATDKGKGIYNNGTFSDSFKMSGAAKVEADNDVYLYNNKTIQVAGALTAESPVATITPPSYAADTQVLSAGTGVTLDGSICSQFDVTPQDDAEWRVALNGTGAKGVLIRKYALGDTGPGGGWVFYYSDEGFTVNGATCHYLECSKESVGTLYWCSHGTTVASCGGSTDTAIGTGYENTQAIINLTGHSSATATNCAAKACAAYSSAAAGAGKWFLPSSGELIRIYEVLVRDKNLITSVDKNYWSSTINNSTTKYSVSVSLASGASKNESNKKTSLYVLAVHAF